MLILYYVIIIIYTAMYNYFIKYKTINYWNVNRTIQNKHCLDKCENVCQYCKIHKVQVIPFNNSNVTVYYTYRHIWTYTLFILLSQYFTVFAFLLRYHFSLACTKVYVFIIYSWKVTINTITTYKVGIVVPVHNRYNRKLQKLHSPSVYNKPMKAIIGTYVTTNVHIYLHHQYILDSILYIF